MARAAPVSSGPLAESLLRVTSCLSELCDGAVASTKMQSGQRLSAHLITSPTAPSFCSAVPVRLPCTSTSPWACEEGLGRMREGDLLSLPSSPSSDLAALGRTVVTAFSHVGIVPLLVQLSSSIFP